MYQLKASTTVLLAACSHDMPAVTGPYALNSAQPTATPLALPSVAMRQSVRW